MVAIDVATSNPYVMLADRAYDIGRQVKKITWLVAPKLLSTEFTTNKLDDVLWHAREFASWAPNIIVKTHQIDHYGVPYYDIIYRLKGENFPIKATATRSFRHFMLAAETGVSYVTSFVGRVTDKGGEATQLIRDTVIFLAHREYKSRFIIGSIPLVGNMITTKARTQIITISPQLIGKLADYKLTQDTVHRAMTTPEKASTNCNQLSQQDKWHGRIFA